MRVFVNAVPLDIEKSDDVRAAVRALDPELEHQLATGAAFVTDARGIEIPLGSALAEGAILRVAVRARRAVGERDADT
jgi:hypothetical protein